MDFEDKGTELGAFVICWGLKQGFVVKNLRAKAGPIFQFLPGGYPQKLPWQHGRVTTAVLGEF